MQDKFQMGIIFSQENKLAVKMVAIEIIFMDPKRRRTAHDGKIGRQLGILFPI